MVQLSLIKGLEPLFSPYKDMCDVFLISGAPTRFCGRRAPPPCPFNRGCSENDGLIIMSYENKKNITLSSLELSVWKIMA